MLSRSAFMAAAGRGGGLVSRALRKQRLRSGSSEHSGHGDGDGDGHGHGGGGGGGGGWFSPGDRDAGGYLFNETPPPPGQSRKWEDWELPYYATGVIAFLMLSIGLTSKPNTNIDVWAHKVALRRLQEEEEAEGEKEEVGETVVVAAAAAHAHD